MKSRILPLLVAGALLTPAAKAHLEGGHVWVIDTTNNLVWEVDPTDYTITQRLTAADGLNQPASIGFSFHGHLLISMLGDDTIVEYDGAYNALTLATSLDGIDTVLGSPGMVLSAGHGDVFVTNTGTNEILHFDEDLKGGSVFADVTDGIASPVLTVLNDGHVMAANRDGSGEIYQFDHDTGIGELFDTIPGVRFVSAARRNNGDVFLLSNAGVLYNYVGGAVAGLITVGTYGSGGQASIAMNKFHQRIFMVSQADGTFLDINANTGAINATVNLPGSPSGLAVGGNQYAPGTFIHNDDFLGHPGEGGVSPHMHATGNWEPRIGASGGLHLHSFAPNIPIFLFMSFGSAESTIYGFEFFIDTSAPWFFKQFFAAGTPGIPGSGQIMLPITLPTDTSLIGTQWQLQTLGLDPAASFGVSSSVTLNMYIGDEH